MTRSGSKLISLLASSRFGIAAFLFPLGIRAIPEILVGPYPVGWDTIAFYVPNTLDWAAGKVGALQMLGTAPLMYMISVPIYMVSHVNPVWIFKVMGPALYGGMIFALFRFLKNGLGWNERLALGSALLTSLYFITLRISWDLYRNMLGLTFILLSLAITGSPKSNRERAWLNSFVALAVAADQLTAVVALAIVGARSLRGLLSGDRHLLRESLIVGAPGAILFSSVVYGGVVAPGGILLQRQPLVPGLETMWISIGFLGYAFLPLVPLAILGLRHVRSIDLKVWLALCLGLALTVLVPLVGLPVVSYRWALLMDIPVCVLAVAGLVRLRDTISLRAFRLRSVLTRLIPLSFMIFVVAAMLYVALPAERAMIYYTRFPNLVPTSMIQDTVPLTDMANLRDALSWVAHEMGPGTVLITHQAIYGWARAYLPPTSNIMDYGYSSPLNGLMEARNFGYTSVLMIWWTNGSGWHGQPMVPDGFVPLTHYGKMVVYTYWQGP